MLGTLAVGLHAGPALTAIGPLRRRLLPGLAGQGAPDHVALTFDDGPDPASTPAFLEALDGLGWRATFFLLGEMAARARGLAAEVSAAGHEVALHGHRHRSHLWRRPAEVVEDLRRGHEIVGEATGGPLRWFRPPYGNLSGASLYGARALGLRTVLWTAWGRDWRRQATPASVAAEVSGALGPGATVLLHDSDCTSAPGSWRSALHALPILAEAFEARGLAVGPLGEHGLW